MTTLKVRGGGAALLHHRIRASHGMVTAEFAVGLLAVVPVMLSLVALVAVGANQVKVVEAARSGARLLARGESETAAREQVESMLPSAEVSVVRDAGFVVFEVHQQVGGQGILPSFTLGATASTQVEDE